MIIGAGFTGLSAAYELARAGRKVVVVEAADEIGGLAAAFNVGGARLDRFYHHWFTNDVEVMALIDELGLSDQVRINPTNTGVYYASTIFKLSTPLDLLKFSPLVADRPHPARTAGAARAKSRGLAGAGGQDRRRLAARTRRRAACSRWSGSRC